MRPLKCHRGDFLLKPMLGGVDSVAHFITGHEHTHETDSDMFVYICHLKDIGKNRC